MKVTMEVDCTPLEARQFLGLPDIQPLQAAVLAEMEKRMMAEMERFSPDAVLKNWMTLMPQSAETVQDLFTKLFTQRTSGKPRSA